jgi:proliferating cell nuclear antigen
MNIIINNPIKADIFVALFQYISKFTENMNLMFENDRFYMQSINTSHVVILEICLPKEWFDVYEIVEKSLVIGVNTALFYKVLKKREKTQQIKMKHDKSTEDRLQFFFTACTHMNEIECENKLDDKKEKTKNDDLIFDKDFEIPLIDIEEELLSIPNIEYQAELSLSTDKFSNLISQLKDFGETLEIECSEDKIILSSNSSENGKMITRILIEDLTEFSIEENEVIQMQFALKYLYDICLYQKISKTIDIQISKDFPMRIMYPLGIEKNATFLFYLAPKME